MRFEAVKIRDFEGHTQAIYGLAHDQNSGSIYSGSADGMLVKWEMNHQDGELLLKNAASIYCICVHGEMILTGSRDGTISVVEIQSKKLIKRLKVSDFPIYTIVSFANDWLIGDGSGKLSVMDGDFNLKFIFPLSEKSLRQIIHKNSKIYAAASDGSVYGLGLDLKVESMLFDHESSVFTVESDATGNVFSGGRGATILVHKNNLLVNKIQAHLLHIHQLTLSPDASLLASCSMDKTIKIWERESMQLLKVIDAERQGGHRSSVNKILWIDKNTIISCSDDRTLKCFEIKER